MAGHSQFKNIMHRKGVRTPSGPRSSPSSSARSPSPPLGAADPNANPRLRAAMIAAREANMPRDNIDRAIKRGSGERRRQLRRDPLRGLRADRRGADRRGADRQPQPHRGRDPLDLPSTAAISASPAAVASCSTASACRSAAGRQRGRGAGEGDRGRRRRRRERPRARACTRSTLPRRTSTRSREALEEVAGGEPRSQLSWQAQDTSPVEGETAEPCLDLIGALEDHDDVQNVYANFEVSDDALAKFAA